MADLVELSSCSHKSDTIVAISTPPGAGGIGIVRISGSETEPIAVKLLGSLPPARLARLHSFRDEKQELIDQGVALFFKGPSSYTGEESLELQGHGGPIVLDLLVARAISLGARPARPGEFTERAFLNGKLDLAQAEAVADLIESRTQAAARAAMKSLSGQFSKEIGDIDRDLSELRAYIEADIDFSEEEVEGLKPIVIKQQLERMRHSITGLLERARPGALLARGASIVLAGAPNAGKSSILNALLGTDRAIVSEQPGTTRDVIEAEINLDGLLLRLADTAGLRFSVDPLEDEGVRRAGEAIIDADLVLFIIDDTLKPLGIGEALHTKAPILRVLNKCDVSRRPYGRTPNGDEMDIAISAKEGGGMDELLRAIKALLGYANTIEDPVAARRRHIDALGRADKHLKTADTRQADNMPELLAEELRLAQAALGEITGVVTTEDLLGQIFSRFCVGK